MDMDMAFNQLRANFKKQEKEILQLFINLLLHLKQPKLWKCLKKRN